MCDTDLSVHPNQFKIWFNNKKIKSKKEAYYGSREHKDSIIKASIYRILLGFFFKKLIKYMFKIKLRDTQCGFKVFHKSYSKKIFKMIKSYRFAFDVELLLFAQAIGSSILEVPLQVKYIEGSSVRPIHATLTMIRDLLRIKWNSSSNWVDK